MSSASLNWNSDRTNKNNLSIAEVKRKKGEKKELLGKFTALVIPSLRARLLASHSLSHSSILDEM